jgi:hypothetical protein
LTYCFGLTNFCSVSMRSIASLVDVTLYVHLTLDHPSAHHNYIVLLSPGMKRLHIFGSCWNTALVGTSRAYLSRYLGYPFKYALAFLCFQEVNANFQSIPIFL